MMRRHGPLLLAMSGMVAPLMLGAQTPARSRATDARAVLCVATEPRCVAPEPTREFRGVWVAAVSNIDWPSKPGLSSDSSRAELLRILERASASGLNAVILQIRPAGDALYRSTIEPWSEYLTGEQGVAPNPGWDPLEFAVREAHARGMELHAWFNPYRARHPSSKSAFAPRHIVRQQPALVRTYGTHRWMDPGEPEVRAHTLKVVLDVVKRYDIDGVHIDDYFYPYPERDRRGQVIAFPDSESFARYRRGGGDLARDDWRRRNVDLLVEELQRGIRETKPWVKFGVSPFGIWRPGYPASVTGFDAFGALYADAKKWFNNGWVDYLSPQLYWPMEKVGQAYPTLLDWWQQQNTQGRHLWIGNYTSRVGGRGASAWGSAEVIRQVLATRAAGAATGNIHFSMEVFMADRDSIASVLASQLYAESALVPESPWMGVRPVDAPLLSAAQTADGWRVRLAPVGKEPARWWLVQSRAEGTPWVNRVVDAASRELLVPRSTAVVVVRAVDRSSALGPPTALRFETTR